MKKAFIAAIAASALASPTMAQENNDVFSCFTNKLDKQIENLQDTKRHLSKAFTDALGTGTKTSLEAVYSHDDKMIWITECEAETGKTATPFSTAMESYSNGSGIKLVFK